MRAVGVEREFVDAVAGLVAAGPGDAVLDVGCGDGAHLAALVARSGCEAHGLDISVAAIEAAARRHPGPAWVVANADRFLPYADASFGAVLSVTARVNAPEFRRVLREDGMLVVVVPAPDDLVELRAAVLGEGVERDRTRRVVEACAADFSLERRERLAGRAHLDAGAVADVLAASYRGLRASQRAHAAALGPLDVTLARDVLVFRRRRRRPERARGVPPRDRGPTPRRRAAPSRSAPGPPSAPARGPAARKPRRAGVPAPRAGVGWHLGPYTPPRRG
jgi:23S rRNA (guanine745-N1)-methyltransferase